MIEIPDLGSVERQIKRVGDEARRAGVTLFGAGGFARAVHRALEGIGIPVRAFVVSGPRHDLIDGIPVVPLDELDRTRAELPMWLAVFNRNANSELNAVAQACSAHGIANPLLPQQYFELIEEPMGWRYWLADRRHYVRCRTNLESVLESLGDAESQRQFSEAVSFRIASTRWAAPLPSADTQYFPGHVTAALKSRKSGSVFVDGGAYDGDTLVKAAAELNLASAFAFEPDSANFAKLARNVRPLRVPVVCVPCGLSRDIEWLSFSSEQGEASAIGGYGGTRIQCVSLDHCLGTHEIDYIKLDVEGHELPALEGAVDMIGRCGPAFAVAAYHRWDDLWRIPEFFRQHAPAYTLTYRAHEYNTFDGVFYALRG